jgi:hypothetical protein
MSQTSLNLIDNSSIKEREDLYETVEVNLETILKSWKISLFSFEWLTPEGQIRAPSNLPEKEREKYEAVLSAYESGEPLERPILGIGVMDNVEIGSRRDVLLTLRTQGIESLSVHISKSAKQDFMPYL